MISPSKYDKLKFIMASNNEFNLDSKEMAEAGINLGHKDSRWHPKIKPYLQGTKNGIHLIDLEKTKEKLTEALKFIEELILNNKVLLLVGTEVQAKDLVKEVGEECKLPYINERWLGGTFTNFQTIKKRIDYFNSLEKKREAGEFDRYTKKERAKIDEELKRLRVNFEGIRTLEALPDAILVLSMKKDDLAVKEARERGVKIIGIADTNVNPELADFPIPGNDGAVTSIQYILNKVKEVVLSKRTK